MNELPKLMPTSASAETFGGVTYHIDGELVPVLTVDVSKQSVYFEHHILLWKHTSIQIGLRPMKGALKRMMAGMQVFVTEASGSHLFSGTQIFIQFEYPDVTFPIFTEADERNCITVW